MMPINIYNLQVLKSGLNDKFWDIIMSEET